MDFAQSIRAGSSTLRRTGSVLTEEHPQLNKSIPQTKPKPLRRQNDRSDSATAEHNKPPAVQPFKPRPTTVERGRTKPPSDTHQENKPIASELNNLFANSNTVRESNRFNSGSSFSPTADNSAPRSSKPPPRLPLRNSSLQPPVLPSKPPVNEYFDDEEAYDDIQQFQKEPKSLDEPPPLPPPNNPPSSGIRSSTSSDRLSRFNTADTRSANYNSATLPNMKNRLSLGTIGSIAPPSLRKPIISDTASAAGGLPLSDPMGLADFVKKFQNRFPIQMKMCSSHNGVIMVNEGDTYNVHFLKLTDVVSITASGGTQYTVPLNSAVEFGVLYNPTNKLQDATVGYIFPTAGEIMSAGLAIPPLVCVQQNCEISSQDGSVQAGDILLIQKVKQKRLRKMLVCTDIRTEQKKYLLENCSGNFSTTPSQVKLYLPQLLRHVPLPQYCILYYSGKNAQEVTSKLPRGTVEVTRTTTQQSIIVSKKSSPNELMEFPLTNNIVVQAIQSSESFMQQLKEDTRRKCDTFNPQHVQSMSMMLSLENPYTLTKQVTLLSSPRTDEDALIGVKLVTPGNLASNYELSVTQQAKTESTVEDIDDDYQVPEAAQAEYEAAKNKLTQQSTETSHYDSPKSTAVAKTKGVGSLLLTKTPFPSVLPTPTDAAAVSKNIIKKDDDDDVYDVPSPTPMPKKVETDKPTRSPGTCVVPPSIHVAALTPQVANHNPQIQKEVNDLKSETKSLKAEVDRLDKVCKSLKASIGKDYS